MPKISSTPMALAKARAYCARQERAQQEVRDKLYAWEVPAKSIEGIISQLIGEGYLNEARFAEHFAVSKFRQKGWGRRKIEAALKGKQVSTPCITAALRAIDDGEYERDLALAVRKRADRLKESDPYIKRRKLFTYFLGKGYSPELIERALAGVADGGQ
jgi:regulatory protein